eukprot:XP_011669132.1 PREDICTED: uncharacterized protein LOC100890171 [Strongylocentrotus purpuratus]
MDTDGPPRNRPLSQQEFFDIYLLASSKETAYFSKMKNLIQRNRWRMTTPFESKLGVPVLESIEKAVLNCSHVVYLITKEDCERKDANHTMTIEMAFQSLKDNGLGGRIIPVFCCDMSFVPLKLRSLTGVNIRSEELEERLRKTIDVSIREDREEEYRSVSELSTQANDDEPLPLISSSMATGQ